MFIITTVYRCMVVVENHAVSKEQFEKKVEMTVVFQKLKKDDNIKIRIPGTVAVSTK